MKNKDEFFEVGEKDEEVFFDFGETSNEDVEDERIIELEDIIKNDEKNISKIPEAKLRESVPVEEEILNDDSSKVLEIPEEQHESEEVIVPSTAETPIGLSEERVEALITKVVQDVVDKAVRETMATTSEKVIKEAIEALKRSLESISD